MNQAQVKYAKLRIEEIHSAKLKEIRSKYRFVVPTLTFEQKIEEIKAGRFKQNERYPGLEYVLFDAQQDVDKVVRAEAESKAVSQLNQLKTKILDNLMLGDSEEALNAIKEFENFKEVV